MVSRARAMPGNRLNTSGYPLGSVASRTSVFITNALPPDGSLPVPVSGSSFYVTHATAAVGVRPSGGVFNIYEPGTGLDLDEVNSFSLLDVRNPHDFPVVFQLFAGFDRFVDRRLILPQGASLAVVVRPTAPRPNTVSRVVIDDISGREFADVNGQAWFALSRAAIIVCNTDTGATYLLQKRGAAGPGDDAIAAVYPHTSLRLEISGDYEMTTGGGNINAVVSELYNSLKKT